jgi:two-component system nitrogen regulation sensor histidine kinase NtrY
MTTTGQPPDGIGEHAAATATAAPRPLGQRRRRRFRLPGRFEWKVLAALFVVALLPLGATGYFLSRALASVEAMNTRHQQEVRESLGEALDAYRSFFAQEKEIFKERAAEIAGTGVDKAADLAGVPDLVRARILIGNSVADEWSLPPEQARAAREAPPNVVELPGSREDAPRILELTFGIDRQVYANFLSLRQAIDHERELDRLLPLLLPGLFRGLVVDLVVVLLVATLIGLFLARRATGRVATLREAASRVAEGDLTVRVAPRGRDELDELGRAFDRMVGELGDARSRLEYLQKVSAWQEVARRLAHEIKNPLTPIQLSVQELVSKYRGEDPVYQRLLASAVEILDEEIGSLRRLVDDFSAFGKLPKVEPTPADLGALVEDFARAHPEWSQHVRVHRPAEPAWALCDRMLIRRVLANLVENAVQAATEAGRQPEVAVTVVARPASGGGPDDTGPVGASRAPAAAMILVDDNGPGVAAEAAARVFDPYVTSKESGTGLGLAIVRKIVIDHGGDVAVERAPPPLGGARFIVELPMAAAAAEAEPGQRGRMG